MADTPSSTPTATPAASPTPSATPTFNPHTTVRSVVPQSATYPTDEQVQARKAIGEAPPPEPVVEDEEGKPHYETQPRDAQGRWTAEEIAQAAADGYDVEGLEPGMDHPPEEEEVVEEAPQTIRIKVHGEEMEVDLATAKAELEMNFGAKKLFSKLDQERKEFMAAQEQARQRPEAFLEHAGHDPEQWAVDFLNRKVALATLSPQERALYEQQQAIEAREEQVRAYEQQVALQRQQEEDTATLQMLSEQLPVQLQAVGLPADGTALSLILPHLKDAEAAGVKITPEIVQRAAQLARSTLDVGVVRTIRGMRGPQLLEALGPDVLQEVRRLDLEAARARRARPAAPPVEREVVRQEPQKRVVMTEAEFKEYQRRRGL